MESAGLRRRNSPPAITVNDTVGKDCQTPGNSRTQPPKYVIDLSLPPIQRYQKIAEDFKPQLISLPTLFDELAGQVHPKISVPTVQMIARLFLRRLYSAEETEELRGIQLRTGIEMHLLVAFNVLLDLLMGCTSGGIRVQDRKEPPRMLHFRTLDWGMEALRPIIVQLEFIERPGGKVIASSITYAGFLGILTAVKEGLSISLNFRPYHNATTRIGNVRFYGNHLLVLLGFRPAISSLLRQCLLPARNSSINLSNSQNTFDSIRQLMPSMKSTAAYLIFSDGNRTMTMEKDLHSALVRVSEDFIAICNHDEAEEREEVVDVEGSSKAVKEATGMELLLEDSHDRKKLAMQLWERATWKHKRTNDAQSRSMNTKKLIKLVKTYPITNEETHFACIMDPRKGEFVWVEQYLGGLQYD